MQSIAKIGREVCSPLHESHRPGRPFQHLFQRQTRLTTPAITTAIIQTSTPVPAPAIGLASTPAATTPAAALTLAITPAPAPDPAFVHIRHIVASFTRHKRVRVNYGT